MLKGYGRIGAQIPDKGGRHQGAVMIEYKGYLGEFAFDDEAGIFHGEVVGTSDIITFQGLCIVEVRTALKDSINEYLKFCAERGRVPNKPPDPKTVAGANPVETL
jgi:predicted HicB family RNase H-like nuclease